jgi:hypothetical protein
MSAGVADVVESGTPASLTPRRARVQASRVQRDHGNGQLTIRARYDTAELGGVDGLRDALRQGFAVGVSGAGLSETQGLFFPPRVAVAICDGPDGTSASFLRRGNSDVFDVRVLARQQSFPPPPAASPVTVVMSLGGLDRRADASRCRVGRRGTTVGCR